MGIFDSVLGFFTSVPQKRSRPESPDSQNHIFGLFGVACPKRVCVHQSGICLEHVVAVDWVPIRLLAEHLFGEKQEKLAFLGKYTISSNFDYGVEKWKIVQRYVECAKPSDDDYDPRLPSSIVSLPRLFLGADGMSLYSDQATKDMRIKSRKYTIPGNFHYAIEKWKAVLRFVHAQKTHNRESRPRFPCDINTASWLFLGADGMSLYLDKETRDMRGELEEAGYTKTRCYSEIRPRQASACLNVSSLKALDTASKQMKERMLAIDQVRRVQGQMYRSKLVDRANVTSTNMKIGSRERLLLCQSNLIHHSNARPSFSPIAMQHKNEGSLLMVRLRSEKSGVLFERGKMRARTVGVSDGLALTWC